MILKEACSCTTKCKKNRKNIAKKIPYTWSKIFFYFWAKYFGNLKNGQKKCPKIENPKTVLQKNHFCYHN